MRHSEDTDEEIDYSFAGVAACLHADSDPINWVIDTVATDHMTSLPSCLSRMKENGNTCSIKLPNGNQVPIAQIGDVQLSNDLTLLDILVAPEFQYNLLSVSKFCRDSKCLAVFGDTCCLLQDCATGKVKGLGEFRNGLYHLVNSPLENISPELLCKGHRLLEQLYKMQSEHQVFAGLANKKAEYALWHQRLGHAPESKLKHIDSISASGKCKEVCLTCPMAKFAKLPYDISSSCASNCFDLVHIDIWGAYRVPARGKFRYFLTIVDDHSRAIWVYLLQYKSQAFAVLQNFGIMCIHILPKLLRYSGLTMQWNLI